MTTSARYAVRGLETEDNIVNVKRSIFFIFSFLIMKTAKSYSQKSVLSVIHSDTSKIVLKSRQQG